MAPFVLIGAMALLRRSRRLIWLLLPHGVFRSPIFSFRPTQPFFSDRQPFVFHLPSLFFDPPQFFFDPPPFLFFLTNSQPVLTPFLPNSLLLGVLNSFLRCVRPLCHCWCPSFSAGHAAFLFICFPCYFFPFVSQVISLLLSPRFGACTAGVRPFPLTVRGSLRVVSLLFPLVVSPLRAARTIILKSSRVTQVSVGVLNAFKCVRLAWTAVSASRCRPQARNPLITSVWHQALLTHHGSHIHQR